VRHWSRFLERILALVNSPGFDDLDPAEQDRRYQEIARLTRAEPLLPISLPPHRFAKSASRGVVR